MKIQEQISLEHNQQLVGQEIKVLVDREEDEFWVGRSEGDSPEVDQEVLIRKIAMPIKEGNFYQVRIVEASHFDLVGEISS